MPEVERGLGYARLVWYLTAHLLRFQAGLSGFEIVLRGRELVFGAIQLRLDALLLPTFSQ